MSIMGNFQEREIIEAIYDVRDRVTRIEEKLNRAEKVEEIANQANLRANEAYLKAVENQRDIDSIKVSNRWAWGFVITFIIAALGKYLIGG
jgi:Haemolysin XhlA